MLIVIEGLDGSGKSTQVKMVRDYLEKMPQELSYVHFPRYDAPIYGDLIGRFLKGEFGDNSTVHPQLVALLFAEDRHGAGPAIKQVLENGGNVLLDRYVYSNIAYQCAKLSRQSEREALRNWIFTTEYGDFQLPKPDLNIFLDVPIEFVQQRLAKTREGGDREFLGGAQAIHEADLEFQKTVRSIYLSQCEQDKEFVRVDCSDAQGQMLPPEQIFEKIKTLISGI